MSIFIHHEEGKITTTIKTLATQLPSDSMFVVCPRSQIGSAAEELGKIRHAAACRIAAVVCRHVLRVSPGYAD